MLISVIVPVYNVEKYIVKCINSILSQTYADFELILIDDGSSDKSGKFCDEFALKDNRVIVIHQDNSGVSSARNTGIAIAKGKYICFVDSDDYLDMDYFENIGKYLVEDIPDVLITNYIYENESGVVLKSFNNLNEMILDSENALAEMIEGKQYNWVPVGKFYRNDLLKIYFDKNIVFGEDLLFNYEILKNCNLVYYVPLSKYHYVCRDGSACTSYNLTKKIDDLKVIEYIMKESYILKDLIFYKEYLSRLIEYYKLSLLNDDFTINNLIKEKCKNNLYSAWLNSKVKPSIKIKLLICTLPKSCFLLSLSVYDVIKKRGLS